MSDPPDPTPQPEESSASETQGEGQQPTATASNQQTQTKRKKRRTKGKTTSKKTSKRRSRNKAKPPEATPTPETQTGSAGEQHQAADKAASDAEPSKQTPQPSTEEDKGEGKEDENSSKGNKAKKQKRPITFNLFKRERERALTLDRKIHREITWADIAVLWAAYLIVITIPGAMTTFAFIQINGREILNSPLAKMIGISGIANKGEGVALDNETPMKKGEIVGGYEVTSVRGERDIGNGPEFHEGVDFATPLDTEIFAPATLEVTCRAPKDTKGGGVVAQFDYAGFLHQFMHLNECYPGIKPQGTPIGLTGSTGRSTGPHLHYGMRQGRKSVEPSRAMVTAVLTGDKLASSGNNSFISQYKAAISGQESGDSYDILNRSGSGAMGKYQFMPATAVATARRCEIEGFSWSTDELYANPAPFLANPALQESLMDCYVRGNIENIAADSTLANKVTSKKVLCQMLASGHYSGSFGSFDNDEPQYWNGDAYPSIQDYTLNVCSVF